MVNSTSPARYDVTWKTALTHAFRDFMAFFFADLCTEIDWSKRPRFLDKELAGITFGAATDNMVADKLVEVRLRGGSTQQARHDADQLYAAKWQLIRLLFEHDWRKERIIVLFKVINWMMVLPEPLQRRYWQAVVKLEKERKMELINPLEQMFLDDGIQKGLKKGLKQGIEQGRREEARELLERQLTRRFGPLSKTMRARLAKASLAKLREWNDAVPEAQSLKQVFS